MHFRFRPKRHQFRHRVFTLLLDLDRLDETLADVRCIRRNRPWVMSFYDRDHGARDGSALRPWVDGHLAAKGLPRPERVLLLSFPRLFGYAFNPLSVYFCYGPSGLDVVLYEVKNTFGDQVAYVLPVTRADRVIQVQQKEMYVSPFIEAAQTYVFTLRPPGEDLSLRIRQHGQDGPVLIATQSGKARPLTDRALLGQLARDPLMTFKIMALIHWHALRLWLKGVPFIPSTPGLDETERSA